MSKLMKTLALLASIAVMSTAFVACGGGDSSSDAGADSSVADSAAE